MTSDELFPVSEVSVDSPRLRWMKFHGVETEKVPDEIAGTESPETGDEIPQWICRVIKQDTLCSTWLEREIGSGDTEHDAIADFARNASLRLWNEEGA